MLWRNPGAFHSLLNGLVVGPGIQTVGLEVGRVTAYLGQGSGEVPGHHHLDIVLLPLQGRGPVQIFSESRSPVKDSSIPRPKRTV